jgi:hypothetical protein
MLYLDELVPPAMQRGLDGGPRRGERLADLVHREGTKEAEG